MSSNVTQDRQSATDHWSTKKYNASASFVPKLATILLDYLSPQPTDRIFDIGCGDGKFTSRFADSCAEVYGVDASPQFIKEATETYARDSSPSQSKVSFKVVDCTALETDEYATSGGWDKVISNAALHWILFNRSTRQATLKAIYTSLRHGGTFVFELGGAGNVAEITAALIPVLRSHGFSLEEARATIPWFFPDVTLMTRLLEAAGFRVTKMELVGRPTKLESKVDGQEGGGVEGWVRLMLGMVLDIVEKKKGVETKELVVKEICEAVAWSVDRADGEGGEWLGYVRLRGVAVKA